MGGRHQSECPADIIGIRRQPERLGAVKLRLPPGASGAGYEDAGDGCVWVPAAEAGALVGSHGFRNPDDPPPRDAAPAPIDPAAEQKLWQAVEQVEVRITALAAIVEGQVTAIDALQQAIAALSAAAAAAPAPEKAK
jgi:hypothetical protein